MPVIVMHIHSKFNLQHMKVAQNFLKWHKSFNLMPKKAHIDIEIRNVDDIEGYLEDRSQWDATMYSFGTIPRGDTGYFFNQAFHEDGSSNKGAYKK